MERYADNEGKLGYKMCEYYPMVRDHFIKRVKRRFAFFSLATYWAGFWAFLVPQFALKDAVNKDG